MAVEPNVDAKQNEHRGTLAAGTRLRNYELVSVLGHGGFGITYYARDTTLGREVAVKEYLPTSLALREDGSMVVPRSTQLAEDFTWGRDRFLEEARILATLEGVPSIVRVYDFLEANGTAYMVMGLARGDTLDQRLKSVGKLPAATVERLLGRLLDGLEEVHKAGFLHRDVKPANIILDAENRPTLIDFGASRAAMADRTAAMTAIFTPRYAAAEQLTSDKQGPWTDIYGVSATVYHAITGQAPPSSVERALNDTYEPLTKLSPSGFPFDLLQGIDAGLAVRPTDRPQSIGAWRNSHFSTNASAADSTVVAARLKPPIVPKRARAGASSSDPTDPSQVGGGPGRQRPTNVNYIAVFSAAVVAVLVLAAGAYLAFAPKLPPAAPAPQAKADRVDEAAKARSEAEAQQKAAAQRKAEAETRQKAQAEAERAAAAEAQEKAVRREAEVEAQQRAQAEVERQAAADAQRKAAAEAQQKAAAEAQQKMAADAHQKEAEARRKAEADAWQKKEAEAMKKAEAEAKQQAEADAAAQKAAEAAEAALGLTSGDRERIQVALTSLGFDTRGVDGVFGPRSREMILDWQRARGQSATGFLMAAEQQALLKEAASALAKYDQDQRSVEEARRRGEASAARAGSVASPAPAGGVACQDTSGRRIDFPNATSCPYGLRPLR